MYMFKKIINVNILKYTILVILLMNILLLSNVAFATQASYSVQSQAPQVSTLTETWGSVRLLSSPSTVNSEHPALTSDGSNNIYVVWDEDNASKTEDTDPDINLKFYDASSGNWGNTEIISTDLAEHSQYPDVAPISDNQATIVWQDRSDNDTSYNAPTIFYSNRNTDGSWTKPQNITHTNSTDQQYPSISYDGTTPHIVWSRGIGTLYNVSHSQSFLPPDKILGNSTDPTYPRVGLMGAGKFTSSGVPLQIYIINAMMDPGVRFNK